MTKLDHDSSISHSHRHSHFAYARLRRRKNPGTDPAPPATGPARGTRGQEPRPRLGRAAAGRPGRVGDARRRAGRVPGRVLPEPTGRRALAGGRRGLRRQPMERHALGVGPLPAADPRIALPGRRGGQCASNRLSVPAAAVGLRLCPARSAARAATHFLRGQHGPPGFRHCQTVDRSLAWRARRSTQPARGDARTEQFGAGGHRGANGANPVLDRAEGRRGPAGPGRSWTTPINGGGTSRI